MMVIKFVAAAFFIVGGTCAFVMARDTAMALAMLAFSLASMASAQVDILRRRVSELEYELSRLLGDDKG